MSVLWRQQRRNADINCYCVYVMREIQEKPLIGPNVGLVLGKNEYATSFITFDCNSAVFYVPLCLSKIC